MDSVSRLPPLQPWQLLRVLQGVGIATKVDVDVLDQVKLFILQFSADEGVFDDCPGSSTHNEGPSLNPSPGLKLDLWLSALSTWKTDASYDSRVIAVASLTIAVSSLQQASRSNVDVTATELSLIWDTIQCALTSIALQDSWSPSRSAQGFLAVPLCSITQSGRIDELFRLHVWLPDGRRGNPDFAVHSHQPFAQSWILAGEGTDCQYQVDSAEQASEATHAEFRLSWSDGKNISKQYSTHQHSSVVVNSGILVQAKEITRSVHERHATYTIPAGVFHRTEVAPNALHATLFYFDSSRGYFQDAPVLGPIHGESFTQIRDPAGYTPKVLTEMAILVRSWENFMEEGRKHASIAAWEHALRAFNSALSLVESAKHPINVRRYRGLTLGELGKTNRRFGRYPVAEQLLTEACAELLNSPEQVALSGELGVIYRQMNRLTEAKSSFEMQYSTAQFLKIEPEICRAIGNLGMVNYQLWVTSQDTETLELAIQQLQERVARCQTIHDSTAAANMDSQSTSQLRRQAEVWAAVALARLSLCFSAIDNTEASVNAAVTGLQHARRTGDPTVIAISHFFCGRAFSLVGKMDEALGSFNACEGCTPAIAFCKEPSEEHYEYLRYMVHAGADMDMMDQDGYKALDYAVFNGDKCSAEIVLTGLRRQFSGRSDLDDMLLQRQNEAKRRKGYREVFQEKLRPVLLEGGQNCVEKLRTAYAEALLADEERSESFDSFKTIPYHKFVSLGRLPRSSDGMTERWGSGGQEGSKRKQFAIFFSYRWLNPMQGTSNGGMADDANHTQYGRVKRAIEGLLQTRPDLMADDLHIWMDYACVDQDDSQKGVAALPMLLAQCDAVISLVDDQYYERAWCSVEALLIQRLRRSYNVHVWYEQPSHLNNVDVRGFDESTDRGLREAVVEGDIEVAKKKLSFESDRDKVMFLERQSLLLS